MCGYGVKYEWERGFCIRPPWTAKLCTTASALRLSLRTWVFVAIQKDLEVLIAMSMVQTSSTVRGDDGLLCAQNSLAPAQCHCTRTRSLRDHSWALVSPQFRTSRPNPPLVIRVLRRRRGLPRGGIVTWCSHA